MSRQRIIALTLGIMLSIFMASMEATVVATAMPTIVSQLGGLASYSWVFSAYMLASTTTVPLFGKFSDLYGRRPVYAVSMTLFLAGSLLCGLAGSMEQLIFFRVVQGLGAGGILPLAFIIIGDTFSFEQRARMQGVFSGVWGVSSVVGPLLGGFLVDTVSWHWVFYINLIPGLLAGTLVMLSLADGARKTAGVAQVDFLGAGVMSAGVVALLLGLFELGTPVGWGLLATAALLFAALIWIERRAADPILPLLMFRDRLFAVACGHGLLTGFAMFGSLAFVPLFVQAVLGTSATVAGSTLTPMLISWVIASIVSSRLLLAVSYRSLALFGMCLLTLGTFLMTRIGVAVSQINLIIYLGMMGVGMGFSIPSFLIAVQSTVEKRSMGVATSTLQFSRSIGGTLGVSMMGAALGGWLISNLKAAGLESAAVSVDSLLDPIARSASSALLNEALKNALAGAIQGVFVIAFIAAALGLAITALTPKGNIAQLATRQAEKVEQPAL
ncbi:MAG: MFS transporter [Chloroflexi bacterium]|nr:MFS transporter [Chloroflexota bacterium]